MPSGRQYSEVLRQLPDYIEASGDEIVDQIDAETSEGQNIDGFKCRHGEHFIDVFGVSDPAQEYFRVRYPYEAIRAFAQRRALENHEGSIEGDLEIEIDLAAAGVELDGLAQSNPESYINLRAQLRDTLASPHTSYAIDTTENGAITYFHVQRNIFPYEDKFSTSNLSHAAQMVVSTGLQGRILMEDAYNISTSVEELSESDAGRGEEPPHRYIS